MNNFSINPNFNVSNFENSITDYNKVFSNSLHDSNKNFEEVFKSMGDTQTQKSLEGGIQAFIGADTINNQKIENLNPIAQVAANIGNGINNSLNELNTIQKSAETDFETFAAGGDISIHEVMISAQKSNLAMQMAIQLRNQALNAYNEFKTMSI